MSFIGLGIAIGNVAGAVSASLGTALGIGALGSTAVGAGGIGSLTAASALAGTAGTGLGALTGTGAGTAAGATGTAGGTGTGTGAGVGGGSFINQAMAAGLGATPETAVPVGSTAASLTPGVGGGAVGQAGISSLSGAMPMGTIANAANPAFVAGPTLTSGGMTGYGKLGDTVASNVLQKGAQGVSQEMANRETKAGEQEVLAGRAAAETEAQGWKPMGKAEGGIATIKAARGGSVSLKNGDYIVPADVVSALGNGSSKAGAKYLTHLVNALNAGPPPKAGSLAKRRAKERHTA